MSADDQQSIEADELALRAGRAIRSARLANDLTLQALGRKCGLSQGYLSQIEHGKALPSLLTLHRIAQALGITAQAILANEDPEAVSIVRAGEGRRFERGVTPGTVLERFLTRGRWRMEPAEVIAEPGADSGGHVEHEGEELLYMLEGRIELELAKLRTERLGSGDAVCFPASIPHRWQVVGDGPARFLVVATPPTF